MAVILSKGYFSFSSWEILAFRAWSSFWWSSGVGKALGEERPKFERTRLVFASFSCIEEKDEELGERLVEERGGFSELGRWIRVSSEVGRWRLSRLDILKG